MSEGRNGNLAGYLARCTSFGLIWPSLDRPQCTNFDFYPKMIRVHGKTRTLGTRAGHVIQSWVGEGGSMLPLREMNGKTCQWNTRRESVNKQKQWLTLSGIEVMTVGWAVGDPNCLSKLTNVGIHACTLGSTHVSRLASETRTSHLLSRTST